MDAYRRTAAGSTELISIAFDAVGHAEALSSYVGGAILLRQESADSLHMASTLRGLFLWPGIGLQEERIVPEGSGVNCPAVTGDGSYVVFTTGAVV